MKTFFAVHPWRFLCGNLGLDELHLCIHVVKIA